MIVKEHVFRETNQVRVPKEGEWFLLDDRPIQAAGDLKTPRLVLTREVREVEIPDPVPAWIVEAANDIWTTHSTAALASVIAQHYHAAKAEGRLDDV